MTAFRSFIVLLVFFGSFSTANSQSFDCLLQGPLFPLSDVSGPGSHPTILADVDGDGDLDIVASNRTNRVTVTFNEGDETFSPFVAYDVAALVESIAVGDIDGDSDVDIVTASLSTQSVSMLLNNGDGSFSQEIVIGSTGGPVNTVEIADIDNDLDNDLIVVNGGNVGILLNQGSAVFAAPTVFPAGIFPNAVAISDIDGDLDLDLMVANRQSSDISILFNDGQGAFSSGPTVAVDNEPTGVSSGDLDSDGDFDMVVVSTSIGIDEGLTIWLNDGNGTFSQAAAFDLSTFGIGPVLGDWDGDGDLDISVAGLAFREIQLFRNDSGSFVSANNVLTNTLTTGFALGDIDGDSSPDFVARDETRFRVVNNQGNGEFPASVSLPTGFGPEGIVVGDLDGDSDLDMAIQNSSATTYRYS